MKIDDIDRAADCIDETAWEKKLDRAHNQVVRNTPANHERILVHHRDWRGVIGLNEFCGGDPWKLRTPPYRFARIGEWTDQDSAELRKWMRDRYNLALGGDALRDALLLAGKYLRSHPVRAYLETLKWDKRHRVDEWLTVYLGVERTFYASGIGRRFLIAMIARVMSPGRNLSTTLRHRRSRFTEQCLRLSLSRVG